MSKIKGFLIDLDGVIYVEDQLIAGSKAAIDFLRDENIPYRFLTNTTIRSRAALADKLTRFGIATRPQEVFSTCAVAAHWAKQQGMRKLHLLLPAEPRSDFEDFEITDENPDAVIVGDLGSGFTFEVLNQAFRLVKTGARLIALQKNRFWQTLDGIALDVGAFVTALEYAAEVQATLIGKPSLDYFQSALDDMDLNAPQVAMIGDDIETNIRGGVDAGLRTILVRTGKYEADDPERTGVTPDWSLSSIADLPVWLREGT